MNSVVLDSSALLALLCKEPGTELVLKHLANALICTVNLAEVYSKAVEKRIGLEATRQTIGNFSMKLIPFDEELAFVAGGLREPTRSLGLSLGDRACLAAGITQRLPVLTAEKEWKNAGLDVEVVQIR